MLFRSVIVSVEIEKDERILSYSCGGGGFGDPRRRAVTRVANDVREGRVTLERARDVYGVIFNDDLSVDEGATKILRSA